MTTRITSDQKKQFRRFVEDASNRALKEVSPDKDGLQRLFEKRGDFQASIVASIRRFTANMSDYKLARKILGKDFISPEEITKANRGIVYTKDQLMEFGKTLPSKDVLEWCRDKCYMLVAGSAKAMSLLEIRELNTLYFYPKSEDWYAENKEKFSRNEKVETRWLMLRKKSIDNSTSKNWNEQQVLLQKFESVPNVAKVVWGLTMYEAVRGTYLPPYDYVRTSSLDSGGHHVIVGNHGVGGLYVNYYWDDDRDDNIGLSASRKQ